MGTTTGQVLGTTSQATHGLLHSVLGTGDSHERHIHHSVQGRFHHPLRSPHKAVHGGVHTRKNAATFTGVSASVLTHVGHVSTGNEGFFREAMFTFSSQISQNPECP